VAGRLVASGFGRWVSVIESVGWSDGLEALTMSGRWVRNLSALRTVLSPNFERIGASAGVSAVRTLRYGLRTYGHLGYFVRTADSLV